MSRALGDLLAGAAFFGAIAKDFAGGYKAELERAAVELETVAKALPGVEQAEWPELAESTLADKERQGFPGPSPLKRTGAMAESITHNSDEHEAVVGSNDPKLIFQELGTVRGIPPRPVLGLAMVKAKEAIEEAVGKVVMERLTK